MSVRRVIRRVLDANFDISDPNTEDVEGTSMIGWSTAIPHHYNPNGSSGIQSDQNLAFDEYNTVRGGFGSQPEDDGVTISGGPGTGQPKRCFFDAANAPAVVGLRHYHHQMQAMKSLDQPHLRANEEFFGTNTGPQPTNTIHPQGPASSSIHTFPNQGIQGIQGFGNGSTPDYAAINISMGEMRGFEYSLNGDPVWQSSTGAGDGIEKLANKGPIKINGRVLTGGTGA